MSVRFWGFVFLNFCAVLLLSALIVGPLLVAKNMAKVAGVKSESKYLIVSQIEKFPNLVLTQRENTYSISYTKVGSEQAFLGILIVNNPTETTQIYSIERISGQAEAFFGEDLDNRVFEITVPSQVSVPVSLFSGSEPMDSSQTVEFKIK